MKKKEKWFYTVCGFLVTIIFVIVVCFTLILTGVVTIPRPIITIESYSADKVYDGKPLMNSSYKIVDGSLKRGHEIEVIVFGSQTEIGESDNHFSVLIIDEDGKKVTSEYQIIKICGTLEVYED
jgi:hypothetical protein